MRPRRPRVSDEAPMIATDSGQSSFWMSGTTHSAHARESGHPVLWPLGPRFRGDERNGLKTHSAQPQPARDDAAQDFGGAALDGDLRRDHGGEAQLLLQRRAVAFGLLDEGRKLAHAVRQLL